MKHTDAQIAAMQARVDAATPGPALKMSGRCVMVHQWKIKHAGNVESSVLIAGKPDAVSARRHKQQRGGAPTRMMQDDSSEVMCNAEKSVTQETTPEENESSAPITQSIIGGHIISALSGFVEEALHGKTFVVFTISPMAGVGTVMAPCPHHASLLQILGALTTSFHESKVVSIESKTWLSAVADAMPSNLENDLPALLSERAEMVEAFKRIAKFEHANCLGAQTLGRRECDCAVGIAERMLNGGGKT